MVVIVVVSLPPKNRFRDTEKSGYNKIFIVIKMEFFIFLHLLLLYILILFRVIYSITTLTEIAWICGIFIFYSTILFSVQ